MAAAEAAAAEGLRLSTNTSGADGRYIARTRREHLSSVRTWREVVVADRVGTREHSSCVREDLMALTKPTEEEGTS